MPELFYEWITPAGLMVLLGGIIWGVQLNISVLMLMRRDAEKTRRLEHIEGALQTITGDLVRVTTVLDRLVKDVDRMEDKRS